MKLPAFPRSFRLAVLASALLIGITCLVYGSPPLPVFRLNGLIYDLWMIGIKKRAPHPVPVIVEIDDKSLAALGQWPWPRDVLADIIKKLLDSGAAAIGLDLLLMEPDQTSPAAVNRRLAGKYGAAIDFGPLPETALDNDLYLRDVIKDRPVILGAFAEMKPAATSGPLPQSVGAAPHVPREAPDPATTISSAPGLSLPLATLYENAASPLKPIGLINTDLKTDGVLRQATLLARIGDYIYPSLSLRTLMAALGTNSLLLTSDKDGLKRLKAAGIWIPVDMDGTFRPLYRGPARTYPYFSAADIYDGRFAPADFEGRIVFIGATATGLGDLRTTPLDAQMPGVEIHATITDNILSHESLTAHLWTFDIQYYAIAGMGLLAAIIFGLLSPVMAIFCSLFLLAGCFLTSWIMFNKGMYLSPLYAAGIILLTGAVFLPWRFWREVISRNRLRRAFSRYVSPKVVKNILAEGVDPLAGEKREVSILFTDVRGFTGISEKLPSGELVRLLNSYFTPMTECVTKREGTLDKFIGDALMAFWNAPLSVSGHQLKAVEAAMEMQKRLAGLRKQFLEQFGVEMRMGAGIHSGEARVGNMGSSDLLDYTCIGSNVNIASRLEGLCKYYGMDVIVSQPVRIACGQEVNFIFIDRVRVKGSDEPVNIYTPVESASLPAEELLQKWLKAQAAFRKGNFAAAASLFRDCAASAPLAKACKVFIERCGNFQQTPPKAWDGVWRHDSK